jgi:hypothetical protein
MSGPAVPEAKVNVTDPDSRSVKGMRGWLQGYTARATNEKQIVIAAEVTVDSRNFGHLEPVLTAARRWLDAAGVADPPDVVLATPATGTRTRWSGSSPTASRS